MNDRNRSALAGLPAILLASIAIAAPLAADESAAPRVEPLHVCVTVPDLGVLSDAVGGDDVEVTVLVEGPRDPHFLEPRPSLIRSVHDADVFVLVGRELEAGWVPRLLRSARNADVLPGGRGYVDASTVVPALGVPAAGQGREAGDLHARGNPHFLVDPLMGLRVARLLAERFAALRPERKAVFDERRDAFAARVGTELVGKELATKYDFEKLARLHEKGALVGFLAAQGDSASLGGWLGRLAPIHGSEVVADHDLWPYFALRFGVRVVGFLEPKPGLPPTSRHLASLVDTMRAQRVKVIIATPYFPARHAEFVAEKTGARIAEFAHQCGALEGTDDYLALIEHNVRELEKILADGAER